MPHCPVESDFAASELWFPRPVTPSDVTVIHRPGAFSSLDLFSLLVDNSSEEWDHKVGPDSSTRLLFSQGKVIKTDCTRASGCPAEARAIVADSIRLTRSLGIWHPAKTWFLLHAQGHYWPCNITPLLESVADSLDIDAQQDQGLIKIQFFMKLWSKPASWRNWLTWHRVITFCLKIAIRHKLFMDTSPSNFGCESGRNRLFYLDDELYSFRWSSSHARGYWRVVR